MSRLAMCRTCHEPLVCTFAFTGKEFICLKCGKLYEWLEPEAAAETPELLARIEELKAEWLPIDRALLTGGVMLHGCETCKSGEPHIRHASPEEIAAHEAALVRVKEIQAA